MTAESNPLDGNLTAEEFSRKVDAYRAKTKKHDARQTFNLRAAVFSTIAAAGITAGSLVAMCQNDEKFLKDMRHMLDVTAIPITVLRLTALTAGGFASFGFCLNKSADISSARKMAREASKEALGIFEERLAEIRTREHQEWLDAGCPARQQRQAPALPQIQKKPFSPPANRGGG